MFYTRPDIEGHYVSNTLIYVDDHEDLNTCNCRAFKKIYVCGKINNTH